jgi:HAE1 family hydrophobic/amphiphilic exporter-1
MSKFFIDRPIVAMVIAIFFVIAGAVMIFRLPVAQFPEIVPPKIQTTQPPLFLFIVTMLPVAHR